MVAGDSIGGDILLAARMRFVDTDARQLFLGVLMRGLGPRMAVLSRADMRLAPLEEVMFEGRIIKFLLEFLGLGQIVLHFLHK